MKVKITITQESLISDATAQMFADRVNRVMNVDKMSNTDGIVTYEFDKVPSKLFTNEELTAMVTNDSFTFEGVILYAVCKPEVLELETPSYFSKSLIPTKVDEDGKELEAARQATIQEYFIRSSTVNETAIVELWAKDQGNNATRLDTAFTPSRTDIGMYVQFLTPYLVDVILTKDGKDEKVKALNKIEE